MILVIPFTGPSEYFDELTTRLTKLGGLGGHRLLVPAAEEHLSGAEAFAAGLRSQLVASEVVAVHTLGAPVVRLFRDGVMAAARVTPSMQEIPSAPVLWLEPGYTPTKADWADGIQSAFFNSGGGMRILAAWQELPPEVVGRGSARHTNPGGWAPVGPAVFPAAWINSCEMVHRINDGSAPWRERLQFVFTSLRAESPLLSTSPESLLAIWEKPAPAKPAPVAAPTEAAPIRRAAIRSTIPAEPTV